MCCASTRARAFPAHLHAQQVVLDERQLPRAAHHVHHAPVVQPRLQHAQQVAQQVGVLVQVEGQAAVVRLGGGHLGGERRECRDGRGAGERLGVRAWERESAGSCRRKGQCRSSHVLRRRTRGSARTTAGRYPATG